MARWNMHLIFFLCLILARLYKFQESIPLLRNSLEEDEKIGVREELDKFTQAMLTIKDSNKLLYHSYIFNSGVGNREELVVESLRAGTQFVGAPGILSWQSVQSGGIVYLLGRGYTSVSLLATSSQLTTNKSPHFYEHSLGVEANISSTSLFTSWNGITSQEEVIVAVAVNSFSADILWYRVENNKLVNLTNWARYKKISSITAVNVGGKNQLVVLDTKSPATVEVFDVIFVSNGNNLEFRLTQRFPLPSACTSVTVCIVNSKLFLVFPLPQLQSIVVYWKLTTAVTDHFEYFKSFSLPGISQVITFNLALQTYLAVNGDTAHILRLTDSGDFITELESDSVSEWLAMPVFTYRNDVVLFSRHANFTRVHVWAGTNRGFQTVPMPDCDSCLERDWSGAVSVPFHHQPCLLLPHALSGSSLITVGAFLRDIENPVIKQLASTLESMRYYENLWKNMKQKLSEIEESLIHVVKVVGKNVITGKWKLRRLETQELRMSSIVQSETELDGTNQPDESEGMDLAALDTLVGEIRTEADDLSRAVLQKEQEVWGLQGYQGKLTIKGNLIVDNLTISYLNTHSMNHILQNTFRKDKPQPIKGEIVVYSLQAEDIIVNKVNDAHKGSFKYNTEPLLLNGSVTFQNAVTVDGDVELKQGGLVNGVDLSEEMCLEAKPCSVLPLPDIEVRGGDNENVINQEDETDPKQTWKTVLSGKNLTVLKVNGVDWNTLVENVLYKDQYQNVSVTMIVKGKLSAPSVWVGGLQVNYRPRQRVNEETSEDLQMPLVMNKFLVASKKLSEENELPINPDFDMVVSELEVSGSVICAESEWGASAADIVLSDTNPVQINADKTFDSVSVAKGLKVEGSVAGVDPTDLLTKDTEQVFIGSTRLNGNVTFRNVTVNGLWNGVNISDSGNTSDDPSDSLDMSQVMADRVTVLESLNGIPVSDLVFKNHDGVSTIRQVFAESIDVTEHITVHGKVCNKDLDEFNKTKLSIKEEQNITGEFIIDNAKVLRGADIKEINGIKMSSIINEFEKSTNMDTVHLTELHVNGNITTELGMNGFNLTEVASNAIGLNKDNNVEGHLKFKDEVTFDILNCEGYVNQLPCSMINDDGVVYKTLETVYVSGKKKFLKGLNISENLSLKEINGHKVEDILTKTTEQNIKGNMFISGDLSVDNTQEESTLLGMLNNRNISELEERCMLTDDTIQCKGNVEFKDSVNIEHFNSAGRINSVDFDRFVDSLVNVDSPQPITGFKNFTKPIKASHLAVRTVNDHNWNDFLMDTVTQHTNDEVKSPVVFKGSVTAKSLFVDSDIEADSIYNVDLNEWRTNAIYINETFDLKRTLHLSRASSLGNLSVIMYGEVNVDMDVIPLHIDTIMGFESLRFESVNITGNIDIGKTVNRHLLSSIEENTLKISGDQTVTSNLLLMDDVVVTGNVTSTGQVNDRDLRELITLHTDQTLYGRYKFDCVEVLGNMSVSGKVSEVNMTEWAETTVLRDLDQEVEGVWSVAGVVQLTAPDQARVGILRETELQHISEVHQEMKANLSSACVETNRLLEEARDHPNQLLYLDVAQEIPVPSGLSLATHFKIGGEEYLAVCEKTCVTTIFKWDQLTGGFSRLRSHLSGYAVDQLVILHDSELNYLVTVSSAGSTDCSHHGIHLWHFTADQLTHISQLNHLAGHLLQSYNGKLYSMNETGVFKWDLKVVEGSASLHSLQEWSVDTAGMHFVPEESGLGLALLNAKHVVSLEPESQWVAALNSSCRGELLSVSVSPSHEFVAVTSAEDTQVPRHSVKMYRQNGKLFDKLPTAQPPSVQWFPVPGQTWLVFLQNHSSIQLYQLQGILKGFQQKFTVDVEASAIMSISLPLASKVNRQPYLIVQSRSSVKILQAVLEADPYLGPDLTCSFNDTFDTVNSA